MNYLNYSILQKNKLFFSDFRSEIVIYIFENNITPLSFDYWARTLFIKNQKPHIDKISVECYRTYLISFISDKI